LTSIVFVHGTRSVTRHTFGCSEYPKVTRSVVRYKFVTYLLTYSQLSAISTGHVTDEWLCPMATFPTANWVSR